MKRAIISDIHGNYEALSAVLDHIRAERIDHIICLGDIVGYGPDPILCLDTVMSTCQLTILGNHDQAVIFDPEGFNPVALKAIYWTRDQLESGPGTPDEVDRRWDFLGALPRKCDEGKYLFVHGSPRDPTNEYVFPDHVYDRERLAGWMKRFEHYCFQGHTHIPGLFMESGRFLAPEEHEGGLFQLNSEKAMINVGSVGQPRDEDPRACYVVLDTDDDTVQYHRVEYDVKKTRDKIYAISELDRMLGDRLMTGR